MLLIFFPGVPAAFSGGPWCHSRPIDRPALPSFGAAFNSTSIVCCSECHLRAIDDSSAVSWDPRTQVMRKRANVRNWRCTLRMKKNTNWDEVRDNGLCREMLFSRQKKCVCKEKHKKNDFLGSWSYICDISVRYIHSLQIIILYIVLVSISQYNMALKSIVLVLNLSYITWW